MYIVGEGIVSQADFLVQLTRLLDETWLVKNNKRIEYYNVPAGFDIETSSFYEGEAKRSVMYIWQFGVYNLVTTGRTYDELVNFINALKLVLKLNDNRRLAVYVHNLPYEFQFIRKHFEWEEVFILSERKPVYANAHGIEFRCSLKLAGGKSLANVGKDLVKYPVSKREGDLDYEKIRTPLTQLTDAELGYCENDIRVILSYIQEKIESDGDITRIPLTNTGYVREYCRKSCYTRWKKYRAIIQDLTVDPDEYSQLKRAFQGGFTHANAHYVRRVLDNVGSHDFTSSYPAVMLLEKFPMSRPELIEHSMSDAELNELLHKYCCLFELEIFGLVPKLHHEHPISKSKCYVCENYVLDNGRVVCADHIKTTVTEQDFLTYRVFYDWDKINISGMRVFKKNYLPKRFADSILGLYERKTRLKGIEDEELNYMISKNMMNAAYGMIVTDPVRAEIKYSGDSYILGGKDVVKSLDSYNGNIRRFLYYPWGVWVTAYARANLFSAIYEIGNDYVYADTDSVKTLNTQAHTAYFNRYNEQILSKIERSSGYYNFDVARYSPLNKHGSAKTIGIWDDEGIYEQFKTLGAKRYLTYKDGRYVLTLAGANKKKAMEFLLSTGAPFDAFDDKLTIPADSAGRLILTYIDDETAGSLVDYTGTPYQYREKSSIHMEASEYNLSMADEFKRYLEGEIDFGE